MWWFVALNQLLAPLSSTDWGLVAGALVVFGVVLLALEILVIPGFGVTGIAGIIAVLAGGLVAWQKLGALQGALAFGAAIVASGGLLWLFPRTGLAKRMMLDRDHKDVRAPDAQLNELLGAVGTADTTLRPAGQATINGQRVDVVTDGVFVEAGENVRVIEVEGVRVVVEPIARGNS